MSSRTTLARPYAKAAFELARQDSALAAWDEMLVLVAGLVAEPALSELLASPLVSGAQAAEVISEAAAEGLDMPFKGFLGVLADNGRLPLLPEIARLYRQHRLQAETRLQVRVVSAQALDAEQADRLREALARRFQREIELEPVIDASVLGGAVVYAGDQVIDGSLRGRLQKLRNRMHG